MVNFTVFTPFHMHIIRLHLDTTRSTPRLTAIGYIYRYFGTKPTSVTSESNVRIGESAMPWQRDDDDGKMFKYQYHPNGDKNQPLRNAPSALNTVIVPNVTLPKVRF
jgi:hypothetical protein